MTDRLPTRLSQYSNSCFLSAANFHQSMVGCGLCAGGCGGLGGGGGWGVVGRRAGSGSVGGRSGGR